LEGNRSWLSFLGLFFICTCCMLRGTALPVAKAGRRCIYLYYEADSCWFCSYWDLTELSFLALLLACFTTFFLRYCLYFSSYCVCPEWRFLGFTAPAFLLWIVCMPKMY